MQADAAQVRRGLRARIAYQLSDASSPDDAQGIAIYTLSDPRDVRSFRYIGQTANPRRRFLQHLSTARLWLPDERPWWIRSPDLRPLYEWIRALYREGERLPAMVVWRWVGTLAEARVAEREWIDRCLALSMPILNVEAERAGAQQLLPMP